MTMSTLQPSPTRRPVASRRRARRTEEPHDRLSVWLPTRAIDHLMTTAQRHQISVSQLVRIVILQISPPDGD